MFQMRHITPLLFFAILLATTLAQADDATSIIQSVLNVDRALEEEIKSDLAEARDKKGQLKNQISDYVKNTAQQLKDALSGKLDKLREIEEAYKAQEYTDKKQAMEEWKNLVHGINQTKAAWEVAKETKIQEEKQVKTYELLKWCFVRNVSG
ncbi:hypothetical protein TELCIR_00288 [Teladorsagia circumcincta]|uniref:Uncharacterized protein n=1 Tax=Teladorsagia circumcincta TaxID=45464 RepID=A0A2G9V500_TELCI|nr:hypothetical protein TELCIR_00288 [Teladorsagia circumcincta]